VEYPNHIHGIVCSDPHILADKATGKYYVTSSGFTINGKSSRQPGKIVCLVSEDLVHWSDPVTIFDCNGTDYWGQNGYPATEMHLLKGKYYLSGTAEKPGYSRKAMILQADNPLGPYKWLSNEPYSPPGWQIIDTSLYLDKGGHPWIIFSHEWQQVSDGQIVAIQISDDMTKPVSDAYILFRVSEAVWGDDQIWTRSDGGGVSDACWAHRLEDGTLIMIFTTRSKKGYAMGYAKSSSGEIYGPWEQMPTPLYAHDGGHCAIFRRLSDNQLMMSQHIADRGPKMFCIFEMEERNGDLHIVNEITGNWMHTVGGAALPFKKNTPCIEEPAMTTLSPSGYEGLKVLKKRNI